jgi:hypothetical protein
MTKKNPAGDSSPRPFNTPPARPAGLAGQVQLRAASPDAVLAVVPHMLGFYPSRSLVVLGLGEQNRVMVTFRYDLPDPADHDLARDIAEHACYVLGRERISAALVVGYGPDDLVAPVIGAAIARLNASGVRLHEVLRADAGRYWSMLCDDAGCCPPEGRSYDPGSHPAAAAMTQAGLAAQPDRDALARTLNRPPGSAEQISRATSTALLRLSELVELAEAEGDRFPKLRATRVGRRHVQRAIRLYRSGGSIDSIGHLAWLAVLLGDLQVRDDAWARMHPAYREAHCRLWTDVLRSAALDYVPAPASLLAFAAWQAGNGALAAMAIDRALGADPSYSMAQLLGGAVDAALPPSAARVPMTPAAVAMSYNPDRSAEELLDPAEDGRDSGPAKGDLGRAKGGSGRANRNSGRADGDPAEARSAGARSVADKSRAAGKRGAADGRSVAEKSRAADGRSAADKSRAADGRSAADKSRAEDGRSAAGKRGGGRASRGQATAPRAGRGASGRKPSRRRGPQAGGVRRQRAARGAAEGW